MPLANSTRVEVDDKDGCFGVTGPDGGTFRYSLEDTKCPKESIALYLATTGCRIRELSNAKHCLSFNCDNTAALYNF